MKLLFVLCHRRYCPHLHHTDALCLTGGHAVRPEGSLLHALEAEGGEWEEIGRHRMGWDVGWGRARMGRTVDRVKQDPGGQMG